jgi:hypothetical protein
MGVDIKALREKLREYDPDVERCGGIVLTPSNCAPDWVLNSDPEYDEYTIQLQSKCIRPKGHSGTCRSTRLVMGWPGREVMHELLDELEFLRGGA